MTRDMSSVLNFMLNVLGEIIFIQKEALVEYFDCIPNPLTAELRLPSYLFAGSHTQLSPSSV